MKIKTRGFDWSACASEMARLMGRPLPSNMDGIRDLAMDFIKAYDYKMVDFVGKSQKRKKKLDGFYSSEEWRRVRYQALRLHGAKCCLCNRDRTHGVVLHVDHIKPISKYPELRLDLSNLQVLCEDCNIGKSNVDDTDWRHK